jgi:hypothetical protein
MLVSPPASFWSDVDRIALCVHRPAGSSPEFRRLVSRLEIPAGTFVVSAARHVAAGRVTLEQLQLLSRYDSRAGVAAAARRHVELGFFRELEAGIYTPSDDFRAASRAALDIQARAAEVLWAGAVDLAEVAASAGSVVAAVAPSVPVPAFAAQCADHAVTPHSPAGRLLASVTELRYLRADLHAHALAERGLYGPTARVVDRVWKGHGPVADELARLREKELVVHGATGWELREEVRRARQEAQAATELLSAGALEATPEADRRSLFRALAHLPGEDPRPVSDR